MVEYASLDSGDVVGSTPVPKGLMLRILLFYDGYLAYDTSLCTRVSYTFCPLWFRKGSTQNERKSKKKRRSQVKSSQAKRLERRS